MEALLDSSFIISCVKNKIDFIATLEADGFSVKVPVEVMQELKDLRLKTGREERVAIDVAMEVITKRKVKGANLGKQSVDEGLIAAGKKGAYIATLDSAIKRSVPNKISISSANKGIVIERE
jgi:rRNA-processing protein FCF1